MAVIKVRLDDLSPLLMHNPRSANPLHSLNIEKKKITSKGRKMTEKDQLDLLELDYRVGLYHDEIIGPYIAAEMLEASIRNAARKSRKGKDIQTGVMVTPELVPLQYQGPRDVAGLLKAEELRDIRMVSVNMGKAKTLRCRPRFNNWSLEFDIHYDPSQVSESFVIESLCIAGKLCGIGDNRPRYGRFTVKVLSSAADPSELVGQQDEDVA